jgi:hypothetical protein
MARWQPKNKIGPGIYVGRRLFDEPRLSGAADQDPLKGLDLRNFEIRNDREFSLDLVGDSVCNQKVIRYLEPRAADAGGKFHHPRTFHGWLIVAARMLQMPEPRMTLVVWRSPVRGPGVDGAEAAWSDDNLDQNFYHAHVGVPDEIASGYFAFVAREIFAKGENSCRELSPNPGQVRTGLPSW